jgi:hypothetical protein
MGTRKGAEKRKDPRRQISQPAILVGGDGSMIGACVMLDVSAGGARLKFVQQVDLPSEFTILLSRYRRAVKRNCILAWKRGVEAGIRFPSSAQSPRTH